MQEISFEVRNFLRDHIQSVWQLDLLIALMNLEEAVDPGRLARILYSSPSAMESALHNFVRLGILKEIAGNPHKYQYAPVCNEKRRIIMETAKTYAIRRVDVINLIFSIPAKHKIR